MLAAKWEKHYPIVIKSWRNKLENLPTFLKYPEPIRRLKWLNKRSALDNLQVDAEF
jgi:transposase-like protein